MSVEKFMSPNDLWNDGKERGNLSWWCKDEDFSDFTLPKYVCANCGKRLLYDAPECYCGSCGSLMVNYHLVSEEYEQARKAVLAKKEERNDNDIS